MLYDQTEQGRCLRILTLIDEYTKECFAIHVGYSIRVVDAITVLEAAIQRYGTPKYLRSDNGPASNQVFPPIYLRDLTRTSSQIIQKGNFCELCLCSIAGLSKGIIKPRSGEKSLLLTECPKWCL